MIDITLKWIEDEVRKRDIKGRVLDVGSLDVNGNPRHIFKDYLGVDVRMGKNVDMKVDARKLSRKLGKDSFDVVLCLNVLEHITDIGLVLREIRKVLKPGGYFFVSMPGFGFPKHDYPSDYWRCSEEAVRKFIMRGFDVLYLESKITPHNKFPIIEALGRL